MLLGLIVVLCFFNHLIGAPIKFQSRSSTLKASGRARLTVKKKLLIEKGTVAVGTNATLEGNNYQFSEAAYQEDDGGSSINGSATLNPTTNTVSYDSTLVNADGGSLNQTVEVSGDNARLEGFASAFTSPFTIKLTDSSTILNIALTSPLSTNIAFNNGIVKLNQDLKVSGTSTFIGDGRVVYNGRTLTFDGAPRTFGGRLIMDQASDLMFDGRITLTGQWTFSGDGVVTGNGNILDISQGGTIRILDHTTIDMTNLKIKGLGTGKILFDHPSSQLRLSNIEIEMNQNYTFTTGSIYAEGPTNIVTKNNILTFATRGTLSVDGIALTYDPLSNPDNYNIQPFMFGTASNAHIASVNGGIIRNQLDGIQTLSNSLLFLTKNNSNALLTCCRHNSNTLLFLNRNNSNTLLFLERTDSAAKLFLTKNNSNTLLFLNKNNSNALLTCCRHNSNTLLFLNRNNSNTLLYLNRVNSNAMLFLTKNNSHGIVWLDEQLQTIDHGPLHITVTTDPYDMRFDVYLSDTHLMFVTISTTINGHGHKINLANCTDGILQIADGARVEFQNVVFEDYRDGAIQVGAGAEVIFGDCTHLKLGEMQMLQRDWVFDGQTQVRGYDNRIMIYPYNIRVLPGGELTMHNVWLETVRDNNIRCEAADAQLIYKDAKMCLSGDYSFTSGSMEFWQDVRVCGTHVFTYGTDQASTVGSCATLHLDRLHFLYAPSIADKDLLVLNDATSVLFLDGATLESTTTGMRLTKGTLLAEHKNILVNDGAASVSEGFIFGDGDAEDDLNIQILPGASLNLASGVLDYQNTDGV